MLPCEQGCDKIELLCFTDASEKAFGCCVYVSVTKNGMTKLSLVTSRVRVAPLKHMTLPRLELLGALLGARMLSFVKTSLLLPMDVPYVCFTDSTIVLHWIKADPQKWKGWTDATQFYSMYMIIILALILRDTVI